MAFSIRATQAWAAAALIAVPALSAAQGLYGSSVTGTLLYPTSDSVAAGPIEAVVGPAVEFPADAFVPARNFSIDVQQARVVYLTGENTSYGAAEYNGFGLVFSGAPDIVAVSLDGSSTFSPVSFTWSANSLYFDLAGLSVTSSDQLVFNVSVVPEVQSLWLLLFGGAALSAVVARRKATELGRD